MIYVIQRTKIVAACEITYSDTQWKYGDMASRQPAEQGLSACAEEAASAVVSVNLCYAPKSILSTCLVSSYPIIIPCSLLNTSIAWLFLPPYHGTVSSLSRGYHLIRQTTTDSISSVDRRCACSWGGAFLAHLTSTCSQKSPSLNCTTRPATHHTPHTTPNFDFMYVSCVAANTCRHTTHTHTQTTGTPLYTGW
jgi:hypothetical protein